MCLTASTKSIGLSMLVSFFLSLVTFGSGEFDQLRISNIERIIIIITKYNQFFVIVMNWFVYVSRKNFRYGVH